VGKALSAAETEAQSAAAGEAVRERPLDIGDARSLILEHYPQAGTLVILDDFELGGAPTPIIESVSGQFARSGNQLSLIHQIKPERDGVSPDSLAYDDHVLAGSNQKRFSL
jgi:hypothetical protein